MTLIQHYSRRGSFSLIQIWHCPSEHIEAGSIANFIEIKSFFQAGGSTAAAGELNRKLTESQKEADQLKQQMDQSKEEAKRLTTETERLLQLVQMSQEEQAQKEKQIMDLTQWVLLLET